MKIITRLSLSVAIFLFATVSFAAEDRPNVLMIMVDDLGFSDIGCYGGEIETPHLDQLAAGGVRFTQFYNTAKCHSSRVSLLTGQYCIAAGDTALSHGVTSAEVLGQGGYFTAMAGKWHLKQEPTDFGFERYFGHLSGACNYFKGDKTFRLNGQPWSVPDQGFYTTVANVDHALKFLGEARQGEQPWYLYVAFNAPHAPLQALPEDYAKYEGRFDDGWDKIRSDRVKKQKQLGLFPEADRPSPRPEHIPAWETLSGARKTFELKRMTALAGMIDRVDQEIGRLVKDLKAAGELENTLIWFVSDNGACPYDRSSNRLEALPTDGSVSWSDSTGWAWARNTPFRFYKQNQFEGGICTPAIAHWPAGIKRDRGSLVEQPAHLIDLMPTFADVTGSLIPNQYADRELRPVSGQSLRPILQGESFDRVDPLHFLFASDRAIRSGDWKAVSFRSEAWELYDISKDRTEINNLADQNPSQLKQLTEQWTDMSKNVLHASERAYAPVSEARLPHQHPEWTNFAVDPVAGKHAGRARKSAQPKRRVNVRAIRARKNTQLEIDGQTLRLTFSGEDGGIAFDHLPDDLDGGPYWIEFDLQSSAQGDGEVFFTTDSRTSLPNGRQIQFSVKKDALWHGHRIQLDVPNRLCKLRLDVGEGNGIAQIRGLRLVDSDGKVVLSWPDLKE